MSPSRFAFAATASRWRPFASLAGWRLADLGPDSIAGLTLAAIAVPEQMATARLGGFAPQIGFVAFIAGAIAFAAFGSNRSLSIGADSTITPIFAGGLALLAATGSPQYGGAAQLLALMVGAILMVAGLFRLGFVADLLSIPVTTGFLAGIAGHIVVSQAPALLGGAAPHGSFVAKVAALAASLPQANLLTLGIGLGVLAIIVVSERLDPRIPGALIGLIVATLLVWAFSLEQRGVSALGDVASAAPTFSLPRASFSELTSIGFLAILVSVVVMMQTAATTRAFPSGPDQAADVNRDFLGAGAANVLSGLLGAFPVNASPPRTAVIASSGGISQISSLIGAALVLALSAFGAGLLNHVPHAALAGVLLFVAGRIVRVATFIDVWRRSLAEFALIVATMLAILILPIEQGVAIGVMLSILHGVWTTTRAGLIEFERIQNSTIWWPTSAANPGEKVAGVLVVALQAPLSFLNAYEFQSAMRALALANKVGLRLIVIEADSLVEIDYTAGTILAALVVQFRKEGIDIAFARLESLRAQQSFERLGLRDLVGADHLFHSVEEAVRALANKGRTGR
jgi:SulP family sulfate permease